MKHILQAGATFWCAVTIFIAQPALAESLNPEEAQFQNLLNQFRQILGLSPLSIHPALQNASRKHSDWMAKYEYLTHYGPLKNEPPSQRMIEEGYQNYSMLGENIACGNSDAKETFLQWAFSPHHLKNMITSGYQHMGIARSGTGNEYCPYYWTNDLGAEPRKTLPNDPVPDLSAIENAIEQVAGPIPQDKRIQLPQLNQE